MLIRACVAAALIAYAAPAAAGERNLPAGRPNRCAHLGPGFKALDGTATCVRVSGSVTMEADRRRAGADRSRISAEARAALDARSETAGGPVRAVVQVRGRRGEPGR